MLHWKTKRPQTEDLEGRHCLLEGMSVTVYFR
jgi:hypothetical protein